MTKEEREQPTVEAAHHPYIDTTMMRCACGWGSRVWTVEEAMQKAREHRQAEEVAPRE